jgi:hypothetical protein
MGEPAKRLTRTGRLNLLRVRRLPSTFAPTSMRRLAAKRKQRPASGLRSQSIPMSGTKWRQWSGSTDHRGSCKDNISILRVCHPISDTLSIGRYKARQASASAGYPVAICCYGIANKTAQSASRPITEQIRDSMRSGRAFFKLTLSQDSSGQHGASKAVPTGRCCRSICANGRHYRFGSRSNVGKPSGI